MTNEQELTHIARTVVLEPQKIRGSTSRNKITDLGNDYILKQYNDAEKCRSEYISAALIRECLRAAQNELPQPIVVPRIIRVGDRTNMIQRLEGFIEAYELIAQFGAAEEVIYKVSEGIAKYLLAVHRGYNAMIKNLIDVDLPKFEMHVGYLITQLSQNKQLFFAKVGAKKGGDIMRALKLISQGSTCENTTILHRDLHLSNILVKPDLSEIAVIDFEHAMLGPLEYELENSIVFNDCKLLKVDHISASLSSSGLVLSDRLVKSGSLAFLGEQVAMLGF